ncbi:MAG TPA: hypothetical protein VF814_11325 [Casimicrobiaceae bacterium]
MRVEYEVARLCGGHWFDAESYELTSAGGLLAQPGYYLVLRTRAGQQCADDVGRGCIGPFPTAEHAMRVMRDLRLPGAETGGSQATAAVSRDRETIS